MSQPRIRWMATCASWAWGLGDAGVSSVIDGLQEPSNKKKLMTFLEGETKYDHIFLYRQVPDLPIRGDADPQDASGPPRIVVTFGEDDRIKSKAVYFFRSGIAPGKPVKLEVACGEDLLVGEASGNPLESLDTVLAGVLLPLIHTTMADTEAWGQCDGEQRSEFTTGMQRISNELTEALKSLTGGIELRGVEDVDGMLGDKLMQYAAMASYQEIVKENPEVPLQFEGLLDNWCRQVEQYLEESLDYSASSKMYGNDPGPRTELDFWMQRMQKITTITEQLKSRGCRAVFGVLHAVTRVSQDVAPKSRQVVFNTLRRWKQIDISITEAFNEAKDNVKYLSTLEKFIEPLYSGTPVTIADSLPAVMNAIKMIHTIAR
ncbi:hypothetical protein FOL47_002748 [Perkinsus chesapeaki]|uniref:Dynein heavy chain tail domain-containing protein n=1 Tax=Perkinsus chesapeaki TaxID=330153 RepID=A0A7J6KPP1_PERCH|nr:hypothetical protein FOL47_002748 [Perkinsus chesapeaki]